MIQNERPHDGLGPPRWRRHRPARHVRTATGDRLRSVTYFTRTDYGQLSLRENLERDADAMRFIGHE
jgi:hypothetical protein